MAWLIDHNVGTAAQRTELFELGQILHEQGTDWVSKPHRQRQKAYTEKEKDRGREERKRTHTHTHTHTHRCVSG